TLAVDDALAVDNRARAELPASRPLDVLVVSATRALGAALGASVAGSRVRRVEPERLAEAEPARVVVYDRSVPPGPPRAEPALSRPGARARATAAACPASARPGPPRSSPPTTCRPPCPPPPRPAGPGGPPAARRSGSSPACRCSRARAWRSSPAPASTPPAIH